MEDKIKGYLYPKRPEPIDTNVVYSNTVWCCYFCGDNRNNTIQYQGASICSICNEKLLHRIKLILKFE